MIPEIQRLKMMNVFFSSSSNKANAKASLKTKRWDMASIIFYLFDIPGMSSKIFFSAKDLASDILSLSSFLLFLA